MNNLNLVEIDKEEALSINGGSVIEKILKRTWYGAAFYYVMDNWEDIKSGAGSAYDDYYNKK